MYGGSILSCCPRNPHGHERALKEEEEEEIHNFSDASSYAYGACSFFQTNKQR